MKIIHQISKRQWALSIFAGTLTLMTPAFQNNFPFLFSDTGSYVLAGFKGVVSDFRPMAYGIFMRHVSLMESLWLVAFVQAWLTSWIIHQFTRVFFPQLPVYMPLATVFVLTLGTCAGITTTMLMPDFLTPLLILASAILLWGKTSRHVAAGAGLILWFGIAAHHSHRWILFLPLLMLLAGRLFRLKGIPARKLALVAAIGLTGALTIPALSFLYGGGFVFSRAQHIFLISHLHRTELLIPHLNKFCLVNTSPLCACRERESDDLLWDPASPANINGGWAANDSLFAVVWDDFLKSPENIKNLAIKMTEDAVAQFFTFEGKTVFRELENGHPYGVLREVFPKGLFAIRHSLQYHDAGMESTLDESQHWLVMLSFCALALLFLFNADSIPLQYKWLVVFVLAALFANALICSGVSMIDPRFQKRVVWLVPLLAVLLVADRVRTTQFLTALFRPKALET